MEINPRVLAQVDLMRARAVEGLARAEASQRSRSSIGGSLNASVSRQRAIKELRSQAESWGFLLEAARTATEAIQELAKALDVEKEFPAEHPAPERTVAWLGYNPRSTLGVLVCNQAHGACKRYRPEETKWLAQTSEDLSDGGFCDVCGTDVLA